jgi:hypothetical protein
LKPSAASSIELTPSIKDALQEHHFRLLSVDSDMVPFRFFHPDRFAK